MSSNTGKRSGALFRSRRTADPVIPTPELQDLYSNFRIAEDRERVAVMNSNDPNLLPDMTMPRPTTLSRSTSNDAPSPEGQGRRSRGKRTGGLDPVKKAKTALVRKIGACAECRHRRIQCEHHDLSLLKKAHDDRFRMLLGDPDAVQPGAPQPLAGNPQPSSSLPPARTQRDFDMRGFSPNPANAPFLVSPWTDDLAVRPSGPQQIPSHPQSSFFPPGRTQIDNDMRGVSANPANFPFQVLPLTREVEDQDILSQLQPPAPNPASSVSHFGLSPSALQPYSVAPPARDPSLMLSSAAARDPSPMLSFAAAPASFANVPMHEQFFLIGRLLPELLDVWECQWGNSSAGAQSLSSFNGDGEGDPCLLLCDGLDQLREHYRHEHRAFDEQPSPFMWKCRCCQFLNIRVEQCPHCQQVGFGWEQRFYGYVALPNGMGSRTATSVRASGQSGAFGPFGNNPGHTYPGLSGGKTGNYNPGPGTGGSFQQRSLATRSIDWLRQVVSPHWLAPLP